MTIGWNFPKNNFGEINGISEAGVETFKGSPYTSLAREICQNSLDAKLKGKKEVIVEFEEFKIKSKQLNCIEQLKDAFSRSSDFWGQLNNKKTVDFCNNAIKIIEDNKISVLRISDFNTTGLIGSDKKYGTTWHNLVKSSGVSAKSGTSGGSYGIGKSAPFACSDLQTIYYSTLDNNGLIAHQGVSRLVTFKDSDGDTTTGKGYYGNKANNGPLLKPLFMDSNYTRIDSGTDIFLLGFKNHNGWKDDMITAVLEGFLISIYEEKLKVIVGGVEISNNTLFELMDKYKDKMKVTYNYYQVLVSEEAQEFIYEIKGLGKVSLKILLNPNLHRKVLITRINGMTLFDRGYISTTIYFAGILTLIDGPVNEFFRILEPPEHNAWEPARSSNEKLAKLRIKELYSFMKEKVIEIGKIPIADEMDAEGVGEYLPDEIAFGNDNNDLKKEEYISEKIATINIESKERKIDPIGFDKGGKREIEEETEEYGDLDDDGKSDDITGNQGKNNNKGGMGSEGKVRECEDGSRIIRKALKVNTSNIRVFMIDSKLKKYTIVFSTEESYGEGFVQINLAGEDGKLKAKIKEALLEDKVNTKLIIEDNKILINNIKSKSKTSLTFILDYSEACSLEVTIYGYPKKVFSLSGIKQLFR